jgi:hypothetical protein
MPEDRKQKTDVKRQVDIAASNRPALRALPYARNS